MPILFAGVINDNRAIVLSGTDKNQKFKANFKDIIISKFPYFVLYGKKTIQLEIEELDLHYSQ
jgi:hypothetical protein